MRNAIIFLGLFIALFVTIFFSLGTGALSISASDMLSIFRSYLHLGELAPEQELLKSVLVEIRIPRIIFCTLIGAVLGITGTAIQGIFRNPLAEPGLIGISSGASFFAALTIVFEASLIALIGNSLNLYLISISAFIGASLAVILGYRISIVEGKSNIPTRSEER